MNRILFALLVCFCLFLLLPINGFNGFGQSSVRVNVQIADAAAELRNLDAFVKKYDCFIDSTKPAANQLQQKGDCRKAAILQLMSEVEDSIEAAVATQPVDQKARDDRKRRWIPDVVRPTPTPAPTPTPVVR